MKIFYSTIINLNIFEPSYFLTSFVPTSTSVYTPLLRVRLHPGCGDSRRVLAAVNRRFAERIKSPFTKDRVVRKQP